MVIGYMVNSNNTENQLTQRINLSVKTLCAELAKQIKEH